MRALFTAIITSVVFGLAAIAEPTDSQKLVGVWSGESAYTHTLQTNIFAADGSFTLQDVVIFTKRTNTYQMAGTWYIKDGKIITTVTRSRDIKAMEPFTISGTIVRLDARKFVVAYDTTYAHNDGTNYVLVLKKVTP